MRMFMWVATATIAILIVLWSFGAFAQDAAATASAVAPNSWLYDLWTIVQPIVTVIATIAGPVIGAWIAAQIISLLNIQNAEKRKQVEAQIRDALHQSAMNGLKYALVRGGIDRLYPGDSLTDAVLDTAVDYVKSKNPDTTREAGVDREALKQIILSKVPDVMATIAKANT